jgi:hypothetical protein
VQRLHEPIKVSAEERETGAQTVYDEINRIFQRILNVPPEKTQTTFRTLNIQVRKSCAEKKKEEEIIYKRKKLVWRSTGRIHQLRGE